MVLVTVSKSTLSDLKNRANKAVRLDDNQTPAVSSSLTNTPKQ